MVDVRRTLPLIVAVLTALLITSSATSAWHSTAEEPNERFTAYAGDPRILDDGKECFEATAAEQDITCAVFYAHIDSLIGRSPLNLQRPGECNLDPAKGFTGTPGIEPLWMFERFTITYSPGFVPYDPATCQEPRFVPRTTLSDHVKISDQADIHGYWYISADTLEINSIAFGTGPGNGPSMGLMPCVTIRMTLETGAQVGKGELLAEGTTTKTVASSPPGTGTIPTGLADPCPGAQGELRFEEITEFKVDLGRVDRVINATKGFVIGVQMYAHDGGDPDEENNIMHRDWNMRSSHENPARVVIPVERTHSANLTVLPSDDRLWFETEILPHFGSYDLDTHNIRVTLIDNDGVSVPLEHVHPPLFRFSHDHDGINQPVRAVFGWDHEAERLPPGTYTLQVTAPNWQHTHEATAQATIIISEDRWHIQDDQTEHTLPRLTDTGFPAVPILILAAGIGALLFTARKQNR